ncbi:MAG: hypothetical protein ACREML_02010, partial [Vulcanimicrobiaceae bacterium]
MLTCTLSGIVLGIGTIDLYVLDSDSPNGNGDLIYASVTTVQVSASGNLSASPNPLQPNSANNASPLPAPFVTSAPGGVQLTQYLLPQSHNPNTSTLGPDGKIWYSTGNHIAQIPYQIGRFDQVADTLQLWSAVIPSAISSTQTSVGNMIAGPDDAVWYTVSNENGQQGLNRISLSGTVTPDTILCNCGFDALTLGSDGNIWAMFDNSTSLAAFGVPPDGESNVCSNPEPGYNNSLTTGPDGALWTVQSQTIWRMTTSCSATAVATTPTNSVLLSIASAGGYLWAYDANRAVIARFTTSGSETDYALNTAPFAGSNGFATSQTSPYVYFSVGTSIGRINISTGAVQQY